MVMLVLWFGVLLLIFVVIVLAGRLVSSSSEPAVLPKIVAFLPSLSAITILVGGLIRWVMKRDRYHLLISKQHETKWSCSSCQNLWTSQNG
jgi:uncharacterized oligopeptide transporter (OPT) family protein